ncbi:hypothetical protein BKA93DRAFT_760368 [Sparassis latifolia]
MLQSRRTCSVAGSGQTPNSAQPIMSPNPPLDIETQLYSDILTLSWSPLPGAGYLHNMHRSSSARQTGVTRGCKTAVSTATSHAACRESDKVVIPGGEHAAPC